MPARPISRSSSQSSAANTIEEQIQATNPIVGKALFLASAKWARIAIRRTLRKEVLSYLKICTQTNKDASKKAKKQISLRFFLAKTLDGLIADITANLPSAIVKAFTEFNRLRNGWEIFSIFTSWLIKECNTFRVSAHNYQYAQQQSKTDISLKPRNNPVSRARLRAHINAFNAARQQDKGKGSPEHRDNDVLEQYLKALQDSLLTPPPGSTISDVITNLETAFNSRHATLNFSLVPLEPRLGIVLSLLLELNEAHHVWEHTFSFGVDPLIRDILSEIIRTQIVSILQAELGNQKNIENSIHRAMSNYIAGLLSIELSMGRQFAQNSITESMNAQHASVQKIVDRAIRAEDITLAEILLILRESSSSAFERRCKEYKNTLIQRVLDEAVNHPEAMAWNIEFAKDGTAFSAARENAHDFVGLISSSLPDSKKLDLISAITVDPNTVRQLVQTAVERNLGGPVDWSVAIPIIGWKANKRIKVPFGRFTSLQTLIKEWGPDMAMAVEEHENLYDKEALCLVVEVNAPGAFLAYRKAQSMAESLLGIVWLRHSFYHSAKLAPFGFLHRHSDHSISWQVVSPNQSIPLSNMSLSDIRTIQEAAQEFYDRRNTSLERAIWERISNGLGYLRSALLTEQINERYLYLWMALEGALGNLSGDSNQYVNTISTGQLVSYRAALLRVPSEWMSGLTYGQARAIYAFELKALYDFRNQAVHEGQRHPTMNEIMLERFQRAVLAVYQTLLVNAFRYKMRNVEEILAWCEFKYGANVVISADLRRG